MFFKPFTMLCLCAGLAACNPVAERAAKADPAPVASSAPAEEKTVSALPEHFDRVRDEQFEQEEDRLRQREHHN